MTPRAISLLRVVVVLSLSLVCFYSVSRAAGHFVDVDAKYGIPFSLTSIGWCWFGFAAATALLAVAARLIIRPRTLARRTRTCVVLIVSALLLTIAPWVGRYLTIDRCLDAGGTWDYDVDYCTNLVI